jgi:hypothetical protein
MMISLFPEPQSAFVGILHSRPSAQPNSTAFSQILDGATYLRRRIEFSAALW